MNYPLLALVGSLLAAGLLSGAFHRLGMFWDYAVGWGFTIVSMAVLALWLFIN